MTARDLHGSIYNVAQNRFACKMLMDDQSVIVELANWIWKKTLN